MHKLNIHKASTKTVACQSKMSNSLLFITTSSITDKVHSEKLCDAVNVVCVLKCSS